MKYTNNAIYTKVYNAVKAVVSNVNVTQTYTAKPSDVQAVKQALHVLHEIMNFY